MLLCLIHLQRHGPNSFSLYFTFSESLQIGAKGCSTTRNRGVRVRQLHQHFKQDQQNTMKKTTLEGCCSSSVSVIGIIREKKNLQPNTEEVSLSHRPPHTHFASFLSDRISLSPPLLPYLRSEHFYSFSLVQFLTLRGAVKQHSLTFKPTQCTVKCTLKYM